jgi:hypothetical protein
LARPPPGLSPSQKAPLGSLSLVEPWMVGAVCWVLGGHARPHPPGRTPTHPPGSDTTNNTSNNKSNNTNGHTHTHTHTNSLTHSLIHSLIHSSTHSNTESRTPARRASQLVRQVVFARRPPCTNRHSEAELGIQRPSEWESERGTRLSKRKPFNEPHYD